MVGMFSFFTIFSQDIDFLPAILNVPVKWFIDTDSRQFIASISCMNCSSGFAPDTFTRNGFRNAREIKLLTYGPIIGQQRKIQ